jgi:hypothetical protein
MKELSLKKALSVSCPTCGAPPNRNVNSVRVSPAPTRIVTADWLQKTT